MLLPRSNYIKGFPSRIYRGFPYSTLISGQNTFPLSLIFQSGDIGDYWDASVISSMYQDVPGNLPVTTSGDNVARNNGLRYHMISPKVATIVQTSSSYFSTPDSVILDFTNGVDCSIDVTLYKWQPDDTAILIAKYDVSGNISFAFKVTSLGELEFLYSPDGVEERVATSTAVVSFLDFERGVVRATYNPVNGNVTFYTKLPESNSWTQLGDVVSLTSGALFDSTAALTIGIAGVGSLEGIVHGAAVKDAIDGDIVAYFNPNEYLSGNTWTSSTGETWTRHGNSYIAPIGINWVQDLSLDRPEFDEWNDNLVLWFDGIDYSLYTSLPADTYTVIMAGDLGICIDVVDHAGGTFTIGPTTWTGGIPNALIDTVGQNVINGIIINRYLSDLEKERIIDYFVSIGAGPERT